MAKTEIEEADLLSMQHVAGVVDSIMKNPQTRAHFLQQVKVANPNLSIPEVDAAAPVMQVVQATNKKIDDFLAQQARDRQEAEEQRRIDALKSQWQQSEDNMRRQGWLPAGIDAVRKFAEENGIADLSIAADAYERRNPQPGPVDSRVGWNLFSGPTQTEDTFIKDMMESGGDNASRLDKEIADTLADIRAAY